ncbi:MAG: tetraacyldisaccharide 4'-kinase [Flavobacteriaceae bacterium]|nr:MAG: tetraacyldisaccharide 4'-kinase [Flavobacteriaceae bacterium]
MWLLRKISLPISLVYALVVYLRNYLYDIKVFSANSFKTPTVCIGNLSVGGTGKTPMIEFLVAQFKGTNNLTVLSRGYGRKTKGFLQATPNSTVEEIGDEPFQIYAKFPEIKVVVDEDRSNAISKIEKELKPDLILLDDAYQHRKVKPSVSILLTTYQNLYPNDWYLPTGNLRDSKREAKRAHIIVVTKCPYDLNADEQNKIIKKLKPKPYQKVLFSYLEYGKTIFGENTNAILEDFKNENITLVTGIANPKPLLGYLSEKNVEYEHLQFKDHHFFTKKELDIFNTKVMVLTTEKDFVRLKNKVNNLYYISIEHKFIGNGKEEIKRSIAELMKK